MTNIKLRTPYMIAQEKLREKEVIEAKKYIKKIWGRETPIRELSYQEIKKLGEELGINIFNVKSFNDKHLDQKYFKKTTRVCKYCNKNYDVKIKKKVRPVRYGVCPLCKREKYKERFKQRKIRIKKKWERLVLDALNNKESLNILEIASKLGCSGWPVRRAIKILAADGKVKLFKVGKVVFISLE